MEQQNRCKNCGGTIAIAEFAREATCEYCGTVYELDENRKNFADLYTRADDAWNRKDFDEAVKYYQQIVDEDNLQSEAHWGVALCRYGIAYEIDPVTYKKMPTCNRINRVSILEDANYQAAVKYAKGKVAETYVQRAEEIDRISKEFLKIVEQEKPYDVFISYKRTDNEGRRTLDSQIAKRLYLHLTEKGYRVFFAEETLHEVAGEKYEPYIFAALNSAAIMILFGSCKEFIEATWVKNEWRRFLTLQREDVKKALIPAYIGGDPYTILPQELLSVQSFDATSPVFLEEVAETVKKKKGEKPQPKVGGANLADRYATADKVAKVMDETDCEQNFAVDTLVLMQGNVSRAVEYISADGEYKKKKWVCSECKSVNTHDICRKCKVSKEDSARIQKQRDELAKKQQAKSAAGRAAAKGKVKIGIFVGIGIAALAVLFFLAKAMAFASDETMGIVCGIAGVVIGIGTVIVSRILTDEGGLILLGISGAIGALVVFLLFLGARAIFIKNVDNLHTPEIVQTYCYSDGTYSSIIAVEECSKDGKVKATYQQVGEQGYWEIKLEGQITEKKNNGTLRIAWESETIKARPAISTSEEEGYTLTLGEAYVKDNFNTIETGSYSHSAGMGDEYSIKTPEDLRKLNNSSSLYYMEKDIDMSGTKWAPAENFSGVLIGNGHKIKNLTIETNGDNVGMFKTLSGVVSGVEFENVNVKVDGRNQKVGVICGTLEGIVSNVTLSGVLDASKCTIVGGVAGYTEKEICAISGINSSLEIKGIEMVGGVIGQSVSANINLVDNHFSGVITAEENYVGGIIGCSEADTYGDEFFNVTDSTFSGKVSGKQYVGGIAGRAVATQGALSVIENTHASGEVTGEAYVGGLAGYLYRVNLKECANEGAKLAASGYVVEDETRYVYFGGLAGVGSAATDCVNYATLTYKGSGSCVGGIMGYSTTNGEAILFESNENKGAVTGANYVGGIVGYILEHENIQLEACKNTAAIKGSGQYVGGIAGMIEQNGYGSPVTYVYDCENTAKIGGSGYVGGIAGRIASRNDESELSGCKTSSGKLCPSYERLQIKN